MILIEKTINSTIHRISMEGNSWDYDWAYNWKPLAISFDAPQYRLDKVYGGACRLSFGGGVYSPDLFASAWPPPVKCATTAKYTATNDASPETFFKGTGHLASITRDAVSYDFHDYTYDVDLLDTAANYDGDTVPLPRAFGAVVHVNPVRLPDAEDKPTYHNGYVTGTKGTDWHVYDDGVNIDGNVTDNGNTTFSLSATPTGEVTISGIGEHSTLANVVDWGATRLGLASNTTLWNNTIPNVSHWADSQKNIIDFLSELCAWFGHLIYIKSATMHLVDMGTDNGARTITEYQFFPSTYEYEPPVFMAKAKWVSREAVQETIGRYVKSTDQETYRESSYPYGTELNLTPFCRDKADIESCLAAILAMIHKPRCRLKIPLEGNLPVPGEKISWTDTALGRNTACYIRARSIQYDFKAEEITVEGEGELAAT